MEQFRLKAATLSAVRKYISAEEAEKYNSKATALANTKVTVTNTGVVSSGKSSLFNALLDCNQDERFPVGAARTTVARDAEKLNDRIELVDTPGIDVKLEDDRMALNTIYASSLVVMIHNIKMGMLHKNEVDWLLNLKSNFKTLDELRDRFIFVCSWIDERMMDDASYQAVVADSKRIVEETLGTAVDFYCVSAKLYRAGKSSGKQPLVAKSGIEELRQSIIRKSDAYAAKYGTSQLAKELADMCASDCVALRQIQRQKEAQVAQKEVAAKSEYCSQQENAWARIYADYSRAHANYQKAYQEYQNL